MILRAKPVAVAAMLLALPTLNACMAPMPPVSVTRFHNATIAPPHAPGSFAIFDGAPGAAATLDASFSGAVARELQTLGFTRAVAGRAPDYVVRVDVSRAETAADNRGGGVSVGVGGGTGGYRSGVGVGVGLDLSRLLAGDSSRIATRMRVTIAAGSGDDAPLVWEARAESVARRNSPAAQVGLVADKLARAIFSAYPGNNGETISLP